MSQQLSAGARVAWLHYVTLGALGVTAACHGPSGPGSSHPGDAEICTPADLSTCAGSEVQVSKRIVRLTFNQVVASLRSLLGNTLGDQIADNDAYALVDSVHRTFPPLANPHQTGNVSDNSFYTATHSRSDPLSRSAARH